MLKRDSDLANIVAVDMEKIITDDEHKKMFHKAAQKDEDKEEKEPKMSSMEITASLIALSNVLDGLGFEKSAASTLETVNCLISEAAPPHLGDNTDLLDELGLRATTEEGEEYADEVSDQIALEIFDEYPDLERATREKLESNKGIEDEELEGVSPDTYLDEMLGETEMPKGDTMPSPKERHTLPYKFEEPHESGRTGDTISPETRYQGPGKAENFLNLDEDLLGEESTEPSELAEMSPEELVDQIRAASAELDEWLNKRGYQAKDEDDCDAGPMDMGLSDDVLDLDEDLDKDLELKENMAEEDADLDEGNTELSKILDMKKPWEDFEEEA